MKSNRWQIINECNDENGNPTQWVKEINHKKYGKYCWINMVHDNKFYVEVEFGVGFSILTECKSLTSAKRWVSINLG